MEEKPNYYAIIPADVRYDDRLKLGEKMMYGEITALSKKNGICYASNNYFAKLYNVSPQAISKWIKSLEMYKYITITYEKEGKAITKRNISMVSTCVDRVSTDIDRGINSSLEGYQQEIKENNININNTSINNIKENIKRKNYFNDKEINDLFYEFLDLRMKLKAKNTDRAITLLLNELNKYDDKTKIQMINNSIMNSWKSVYEIKNSYKKENKQLPDWFNKEIKEEETSDEVKRMLEYVNGKD